MGLCYIQLGHTVGLSHNLPQESDDGKLFDDLYYRASFVCLYADVVHASVGYFDDVCQVDVGQNVGIVLLLESLYVGVV